MSLLVNLVADHAALRFGPGYRIHASRDQPLTVAEQMKNATAVRTVCGSDVPPAVVGLVDRPGTGLLMSWPPPPENRCTDCEAVLGRPRRPRHGWGTWERLIDESSPT